MNIALVFSSVTQRVVPNLKFSVLEIQASRKGPVGRGQQERKHSITKRRGEEHLKIRLNCCMWKEEQTTSSPKSV